VQTHHRGIDRHNTASSNIISGTICISRRVARIATTNNPSGDHGLRVPTRNHTPWISSRHDASWVSAAILGVLIWISDYTAHVAASRSAGIVARRVVGAAEAILATSGHTKARVVIFRVVALAIADLDSGLVAVLVVAETHLADRGISLDRDWR
jgi:hypothetical protein